MDPTLEHIPAFARDQLRPISQQPFVIRGGRDPRLLGLALRHDGWASLSRGVVVVPHPLVDVGRRLAARSIRIIEVDPEQESDANYVAGRLLLTQRGEAAWNASAYDTGIVTWATNARLPSEPDREAEAISRVVSAYALLARRHGFLVVLRKDAEPLYTDLID